MRLESKVKLNVRGKVFGGEKNLACIPMIPATREDLIEETKMVAELKPDVIEWRVDYFEKAADAEYVKESLEAVAPYVEEIPVIFTFRHACEGGAKEYPQDVVWQRLRQHFPLVMPISWILRHATTKNSLKR